MRLDGALLLGKPLEIRRPALERFAALFPKRAPGRLAQRILRLSPATTSRTVVEGWYVIAKKLGIPYAAGSRDGAVKIKRVRTLDCAIGGFRYAPGSTNRVGSLLLGLYDEQGLLDYVGFCSAFSNAERAALVARLQPFIGEPGFTGGSPDAAPSRWSRGKDRDRDRSYVKLNGQLVLEVAYDQTTGGRLRHGTRPLRWRLDKPARACTADQLETPGTITALLG